MILLSYGENELANKTDDLSTNDLELIGNIAGKKIGKLNLVDRTIVAGAIDFFEGGEREPKFKRRKLKGLC